VTVSDADAARLAALDPEIAKVLVGLAVAPGSPEPTVEEARAASERVGRELGGAPQPVAAVVDRTVPGPAGEVPVRVYRPQGLGPLPVVAWFHGGGWVVGSLDGFDPLCRAIANAAGAVVVSVGYRLAPEHPFPAALEDAEAVARWLGEHAAELGGDSDRLALAGDSAGGNLATVVARRQPGLARFQALVYPVCDGARDTASYHELRDGYGLTAPEMARFFERYLNGAPPLHPDVSPLRAEDLSGLPPAYILSCEYDVLRDEAEAYARALEAAGVPVVLRRWDGVVHGFLRWSGAVAVTRRAVVVVGEAVWRGLG